MICPFPVVRAPQRFAQACWVSRLWQAHGGISWLDRYARMMRRLADAVIQACERLTTLHVAQKFGLHWTSVRLLERRALQAVLSELPKAQPRRLVMDEFALFKGHRYASVMLDADTRRVLWLGEGRSRGGDQAVIRRAWARRLRQIEAVAMDVNDDAGGLTPRGDLRFIASRLAPTGM